jgi:hypothetical protein
MLRTPVSHRALGGFCFAHHARLLAPKVPQGPWDSDQSEFLPFTPRGGLTALDYAPVFFSEPVCRAKHSHSW